jgi:hypothetical protein
VRTHPTETNHESTVGVWNRRGVVFNAFHAKYEATVEETDISVVGAPPIGRMGSAWHLPFDLAICPVLECSKCFRPSPSSATPVICPLSLMAPSPKHRSRRVSPDPECRR